MDNYYDLGEYALDDLLPDNWQANPHPAGYRWGNVYTYPNDKIMAILRAHGFRSSTGLYCVGSTVEYRPPAYQHLGITETNETSHTWHRDGVSIYSPTMLTNRWIATWANVSPTGLMRRGVPELRVVPPINHLVVFDNDAWLHKGPSDPKLDRHFIRQYCQPIPQ